MQMLTGTYHYGVMHYSYPLGVIKASVLTHTYPHKPQRKTEVADYIGYAMTRLTAHFMCGLTS